ncbi:MAG: hypothetical protein ACKVX9_22015 [Blastocatellia bacterium]
MERLLNSPGIGKRGSAEPALGGPGKAAPIDGFAAFGDTYQLSEGHWQRRLPPMTASGEGGRRIHVGSPLQDGI